MDNTSKILQQLQRLTQLVGGWKSQSEIPNIERELVLDKLKSIYDEVVFMDYVVVEVDAPVEGVSVEDAAPEPVAPEVEPVQTPVPVVAPEPEVEPAPVSAVEPEPTPKQEPEVAPRVESEVAPRRVNPEVIRSLYGDGAISRTQTPTPASAPVSTPAPAVVEPAIAEVEPVEVPERPAAPVFSPSASLFPETSASVQGELPLTQPVSQPAVRPVSQPVTRPISQPAVRPVAKPSSEEHSSVRVLGESIGAAPAVNEVFAQQHPLHDVASKLRSSAVSQLQSSIGINDRFLLLRDLFGGDMGLYNQTISTLDRCSDLDDALIYIQENFAWKPDTEAVNFLIDLLERKFEA